MAHAEKQHAALEVTRLGPVLKGTALLLNVCSGRIPPANFPRVRWWEACYGQCCGAISFVGHRDGFRARPFATTGAQALKQRACTRLSELPYQGGAR